MIRRFLMRRFSSVWAVFFAMLFVAVFAAPAAAVDLSDELYRIITQKPDGYWTDDEAGDPVRVEFISIDLDEKYGFARLEYKRVFDGELMTDKTRLLMFQIVDGNVIEIAGEHHFALSFDGMIFRIDFDTQRLIPAEWQK